MEAWGLTGLLYCSIALLLYCSIALLLDCPLLYSLAGTAGEKRGKKIAKKKSRPRPGVLRETTAGFRFPGRYCCCGGACWSGAPWPRCCPHWPRWACISSHFFCWLESRRPRICASAVLRISIIFDRRSS